MSDLQDALDDYDRSALAERMQDPPMLGRILYEARLVADPNLEAMVAILRQLQLDDDGHAGLAACSPKGLVDLAQTLWAAALSPSEDPT